jgi:hypothetical protein
MSDKANKQTKAELHAMLAEAVRNTQPQPPVRNTQPEPVRDAQPAPRGKTRTRPAPKRTAKIKRVRGVYS